MKMNNVEAVVFPSDKRTIMVEDDPVYGGAHRYHVVGSLGFEDGEALYDYSDNHVLQFVHKTSPDGPTIPGLQNEQLALVMRDRVLKLNAKYPSTHNEKMITGLQMFLDACRERVEERMNRGVMGQLKS
jgi:hypothetical protein